MNAPILRAELRYQRHSGTLIRRRALRYAENAILIAGLGIAGLLFLLELWSAWTKTDLTVLLVDHDLLQLLLLNILPLVLLPLTLVLHFGLMLRAIMLSTGVIRREQIGGTWELLKLTGQSPARIILGKWAATIANLTPRYLLLAALRVGVIIFIGLELYRFDNFYIDRNSVQFFFTIKPLPFLVDPAMLIAGALLITGLTLLNLLLTSALGVLISALRRGGHTGDQVALTVALRTMLLVLPALLLIPQGQSADYYTAVAANSLGFALVDNGTLVASALLTAPRYRLNFVIGPVYSQFFPPNAIPTLIGVYVLLMVVSLSAAIWIVRRRAD